LPTRSPSLFASEPLPPGFLLRPDFLDAEEERALAAAIASIAFARVEMRGGVARRRVAHYGWTYGYDARRTEPGTPIPAFLVPLRAAAASWAGLEDEEFGEALVTEYPAGAGIGWHRDAPMFGDVIAGISVGAACTMKFRPYVSPKDLTPGRAPRRATHAVELPPRSAYLITGPARREFEHSIPATEGLRYSITFRTLRGARGTG
jgi:alkylated DNA repair dioxygenase AlkB